MKNSAPDSSDLASTDAPVSLAELMDRLPFGLVVYHLDDPDDPGSLRLLLANDAASRAVGFDAKAEIGKTFHEALPQAIEAGIPALYAEVALSGEGKDLGDIAYGDDRIAPGVFRVEAVPLPDLHVAVVFEDVTEQRSIEDRIRRNEEELRSLAEATFEGIVLSADGEIVLVNEAFCEMMGYPADELIGMSPAEEGSITVAAESRADVEARLASGFEGVYEAVLRRKDGSTFPAELRARMIPYGGRSVRATAVRDVTERVQTLEATRRQALRFRGIFDSAFQFIFLIRPDGTLVEANRAALDFVGVESEDVVGDPAWTAPWWALSDEARTDFRAAIERAAEGEVVRYVVDVSGSGDRVATLDLSVKAVADEGGRVELLIAEGRDITEDVHTQQELRRLKETQRRLALEEARYRSLIDATSAIVWMTPPSGEFDAEQESWGTFTGQTTDELLGAGWLDAVHPDDRAHTVEAWKDAVARQGLYEVEHRIRRHDGVYRTMTARAVPIFDAEGELREWVGAHTDVHDAREAEEARRQSEAQLLAFVDNLPELAWSARPDGHIDFYNRRWYEYTGTTPEEMEGWGWKALHDPEVLPEVIERWEHSIETGEAFEMAFPLRGADGAFRWFLTRIRPLLNDDGEVTRWVGTNADIDEQRRLLAERDEALARAEVSEARYRFLGETLRQQVWTSEPDGQLDYVNQHVLDYFGRTYAEMIGKGWQGVVHPDDLATVVERWTRSLETGEPYEVEFRLLHHDGRWRWHLGRANALRDDDGRLVKWFGTNTDIQEKKEAEEILAEANRVLEQRVAERTQALEGFSEDLKALHRITTTEHDNTEAFFQDYLRAGCDIFEVPIGILSETPRDEASGERIYRIRAVESDEPGLEAGFEIPLRDAFCDAVVGAEATVSYGDTAEVEGLSCHPAYTERGLRAFIGTPVYVDGALFGTLNFVSPEPRPEGFAPHEHELIEVIAELVGRLLSQQRAERARAEADLRYRSVVRTIDEGLLLVGSDGRILMSNPAAVEILGLDDDPTYGRIAGTPRFRVVRPDGTPFPEDELPEREVLRTGEPVKGVIQGIERPGGEVRWYSVNARAAEDSDPDRIETVVVTFTDVTEQRQAEAELRESEAQLQTAQEIAQIGSWKWDIAADEIQWSDELYRIFGLTPEAFEPTYQSYLQHLHPDDREAVHEVVAQALEQRSAYELDHRVLQADGSVRYVHSLGEVLLNDDGEPVALQGTAQDVTESYQTKRAIEKLSRELEQILEAAGEGIYGLAADGTTTFVNRAAADMIGWEPADLLGQPQHDVLHHHHADGSVYPVEECPVYQTLRDGVERRITGEVFWRKDGTSFPVEYVTAPMRAEGEAVGAVVVFQDITERVRAELDMQRYADDLEERNAELEQFAYVASHDLQEPLRMVSSFLQLLQRRYADQLDDTADEYINYAVDGAKRMQILIRDLLAYSRVGTRGKPFRSVDMNRTLEIVLTDLGPALEEVDADMQAEPLPTITADETQMRQLLQNLVANAVKFRGEAPPEVRISAERAEDGGEPVWRFAVADNGIGIEAHHADRIFQIFQRLHTRDEYEGTGIGLAMCKKIIERHRGRIWFESELGVGSTFYFTVPVQPQ